MDQRVNIELNFTEAPPPIRTASMLKDLNEHAKKFRENAGAGFEEAGESAKEFEEEVRQTAKTMKDYEAEAARAKSVNDSLKKSFLAAAKESSIFGVSIGDIVDKFDKTKTSLKGVQSGLKGTAGGFKALRAAIAATGIGALLLALTSLVALFTKTQKGADRLAEVFAVVSNTTSIIVDRLSNLGSAIFGLFNGTLSLSEAFDQAKQSFTGFAQELVSESKAVIELTRRKQALRDQEIAQIETTAKLRNEIEALRNASRDEMEGRTKQIANAQKALDLQAKLNDERLRLARENAKIIAAENALGESTADDLRREAEARAEVADLEAEYNRQVREDLGFIQGLRRAAAAEEKARLEAQRKALESYTSTLRDRVIAAQLDELEGVEKLTAQYDLLRQEVEKLKERGEAFGGGFEREIQILFDSLDRSFEKSVKKLREGDSVLTPFDLLGGRQTDFEKAGADAIESLGKAFRESDFSAFDQFKADLLAALNISEAEFQQVTDAVGRIFNNIAETITGTTDLEIKQQERLINAINSRIDSLENQLDRELDLRREGLANNASLVEKELKQEQENRRKAQTAQIELQKKAAAQQFAIDAATQTSALVTSLANILKESSKLGLLGVFTAGAGIVALIKTYQKFRTQIKGLSETPKLRGGGYLDDRGILVGPSHEGGGIALVYGDKVVEAEGGEAVLPKIAVDRYGPEIEQMRLGTFLPDRDLSIPNPGLGIGNLLERAQRAQADFQKAERQETARLTAVANRDQLEEIFIEIAANTAETVRAIERKKDTVVLPDGSIRESWTEGSKEITKITKARNH